jgi:hypothetical protein
MRQQWPSPASHSLDGHTNIARICLTYLSFDVFANWLPPNGIDVLINRMSILLKLKHNALLSYASQYWLSHVHAGSEKNIKDLVVKFFKEESKL